MLKTMNSWMVDMQAFVAYAWQHWPMSQHLLVQPLTGTLPDMTTTLVTFGASNNRLTGPLPASLGRTPNLRTLRVGGNRFSGTVPSGGSCQGMVHGHRQDSLVLSSEALRFAVSSWTRNASSMKHEHLYLRGKLACSPR